MARAKFRLNDYLDCPQTGAGPLLGSGTYLPDLVHKVVQLAEIRRVVQIMEKDSLSPETAVRTLVVTSPLPGEGKTVVTSGLAVRLAGQSGRKVLVVDAHWADPALHLCFRKKQNFEYEHLMNGGDPQRLVKKTAFSGLDILTAPLFSASRTCEASEKELIRILQVLSLGYDSVILDAGPLSQGKEGGMDPMRFSVWADATILVVLGGQTPGETTRKSVLMFHNAGANLLGVLMNQWQNPF